MAHYKRYKLIESTDQALEYYYIPQHNVFIPKGSSSQRVLITLLSEAHDVHAPTHVSDYPVISRTHSYYFPNTPKLAVKIMLIKYISLEDHAEIEKKQLAKQLKELAAKHDIDLDNL